MEHTKLGWYSLWRGRRVLRLMGTILSVLVMVGCCFGCGVLGYVFFSTPELDLSDVAPDGYRSVVLDDDGSEILDLVGAEANRVYITLDEMPNHLAQAFVAIEDERFYYHPGIDLRGIARAVVTNLKNGHATQGASTITQQLIKNNIFAATWTEENTLWDKVQRKLQEQVLAIKLENRTDKDWILENYLNTINLGAGTWGVQTAAQRYFGKDASQLTLSESAVLAGITRSPSGYNPLKHPEESRRRQLLVLEKMLELGYIDQTEYDKAVADDVYDHIQENSTAIPIDIFSYFEDELIYQVVADLQEELGYSEEDAWRLIYRGGITIQSTQNTALQTICEHEINDDTYYTGDQQSSIVVMDPYTGAVKAMVGGRGEKSGSLTFNRATSSVRQPGSTIKVFADYAPLLDSGDITLAQVYDDAPTSYSNGTPIRNASGTYAGRVTVRQALAKSLNTVALQCFQQSGMDLSWLYLENFGFAHLTPEDQVESLALGGTYGGVTTLEITAAYGAIANGGTYYHPTYYTQVLDREGNVLLRREVVGEQIIQPTTAALLTAAMEDVLTIGTGKLASFEGMALAGKSGTTTDMRDAWFAGYSPYYVCAVWGGYDSYEPQTSSAYVKKLWRAVMEQGHKDLPSREFTGLGSLTQQKICSKCGLLAVTGLCDSTIQGDMTYTERFIPGTEPTAACTCHTRVVICQISGQHSSVFCPDYALSSVVYLQSATEGTADYGALAPQASTTCSIHNNFWNWMFPDAYPGTSPGVYPGIYPGNYPGTDSSVPESQQPQQEEPSNGFENIVDWIMGLAGRG